MKQLVECLINEGKTGLNEVVNNTRMTTKFKGCDVVLFHMLILMLNDGKINKEDMVNHYMNTYKNDASKYSDLGKNALKDCDLHSLEKTLGMDAADYIE